MITKSVIIKIFEKCLNDNDERFNDAFNKVLHYYIQGLFEVHNLFPEGLDFTLDEDCFNNGYKIIFDRNDDSFSDVLFQLMKKVEEVFQEFLSTNAKIINYKFDSKHRLIIFFNV